MIVIVEDRGSVGDAYRTSFGREGISASGFSSDEFEGWVSGAAEEEVRAIEAVLFGECSQSLDLVALLRRRSAAAIIAMKEQRSLASTLDLFANGFDDVISKPCHVREILARIEAISRRTRADPSAAVVADIKVFYDGREPLVGGEALRLPRRELRILEFLVASRSRRVTKSQIFNSVYGLFDQEIDETVVESHICKLRRRLRSRLGYDPIESFRHLGYRLVCRSASEAESCLTVPPCNAIDLAN